MNARILRNVTGRSAEPAEVVFGDHVVAGNVGEYGIVEHRDPVLGVAQEHVFGDRDVTCEGAREPRRVQAECDGGGGILSKSPPREEFREEVIVPVVDLDNVFADVTLAVAVDVHLHAYCPRPDRVVPDVHGSGVVDHVDADP